MAKGRGVAPLTAREWRIYRAGAVEGAERTAGVVKAALEEVVSQAIEQFVTRMKCGGVELRTPRPPTVPHPMTAHARKR